MTVDRISQLRSHFKMAETSKPKLHLYTMQTPNGIKASITLEELGLPYEFTKIDITKDDQFTDAFKAINPNSKIPALTDTFGDGKTIRIFESGSIQQYLIDEYDQDHKISYPKGTREYYEMINWLFFLNAGVGPMQGNANHFYRYAPEKIPYGIKRYQNETRRLYRVLDDHLSKTKTPYLVGDKCTIADIAHWGWIAAAFWAGVSIDEFPTLKEWEARMWARPAVKKGADCPDKYTMKETAKLSEEELEKKAKGAQAWIQKGMKEADAKKS